MAVPTEFKAVVAAGSHVSQEAASASCCKAGPCTAWLWTATITLSLDLFAKNNVVCDIPAAAGGRQKGTSQQSCPRDTSDLVLVSDIKFSCHCHNVAARSTEAPMMTSKGADFSFLFLSFTK